MPQLDALRRWPCALTGARVSRRHMATRRRELSQHRWRRQRGWVSRVPAAQRRPLLDTGWISKLYVPLGLPTSALRCRVACERRIIRERSERHRVRIALRKSCVCHLQWRRLEHDAARNVPVTFKLQPTPTIRARQLRDARRRSSRCAWLLRDRRRTGRKIATKNGWSRPIVARSAASRLPRCHSADVEEFAPGKKAPDL